MPASVLDPSVNHAAVIRAVRRSWARHQRSEAELCLGLHRLCRDNVHRGRGRSRFDVWAEKELGIPAKLAGLWQWIGSLLADLPLTRAALEKGEITYTKVREYIAKATPATEAEWLEYAKTHTNRQIEAHVRRKEEREGSRKRKVVSRVSAEGRQAARKAREVLSNKQGRRIPPRDLFEEMAKAIATGGVGEIGKPGKSPAYVAIQPCPICLDSFVPVPEGLLRVPMRDWVDAVKAGAEIVDLVDHYFCDCEGEKHRRDRCPNWTPAKLAPPKGRYVPAEWRRMIDARDGFVCRAPDCPVEFPLHGSHLTPFREGIPAHPEKARKHCGNCNSMIETGRLRVVGDAPYERYFNADGEFLGWGYRRVTGKEGPPDPHVGNGRAGGGEARSGRSEPPERPPDGPPAA